MLSVFLRPLPMLLTKLKRLPMRQLTNLSRLPNRWWTQKWKKPKMPLMVPWRLPVRLLIRKCKKPISMSIKREKTWKRPFTIPPHMLKNLLAIRLLIFWANWIWPSKIMAINTRPGIKTTTRKTFLWNETKIHTYTNSIIYIEK